MARAKINRSNRQKPVLVCSHEESVWGSCKIITPNLEQSYERLWKNDFDKISLPHRYTPAEAIVFAQKIYSLQPTKLVFISHAPHPKLLIEAIALVYKNRKIPDCFFHVYGDFTLYPIEWLSIEKILLKTRTHFFCASHRQQDFVNRFFKGGKVFTSVCPFPVDGSIYKYDNKKRMEIRKSLNASEDEFLILYTGRLSAQKNSIRLTKEVATFIEKHPGKVRFLVAGAFDDLGAPFFGIKSPAGSFEEKWKSLVQSFPKAVRSQITYFGQLGANELKRLYLASDLYVSLSTHHDEDFGMSPAEALCCGCPVLLSDWAGYHSFNLKDGSTHIIPLKLNQKGIWISSASIQAGLENSFKRAQTENPQQKKMRSELFLKHFSIDSVKDLLPQKIDTAPPYFRGFSRLAKEYRNRYLQHRQGFLLYPMGPRRDTFYFEVYKSYYGVTK